MTEIVRSLIDGFVGDRATVTSITHSVKVDELSEEELEQIINFSDPDATIEVVTKETTRRVCNTAIVHRLKILYKGQCQICGHAPFDKVSVDICEAHHIELFSVTQNNDANNIIIVCPNHHRLLHKLNPTFDREKMKFSSGETVFPILLDFHLKQ